ncbi:MAG: hypothetical protein IT460_17630 [Planctomycetes bacterium]|nr:hypothetical protein [Planctomycetota bacterium]
MDTRTRFTWGDRFLPPPGDQCRTDACVGWAVGYALKSFFDNRDRLLRDAGGALTQNDTSRISSPSWVFNLSNFGVNRATSTDFAVLLVHRIGTARLTEMPLTCDPARLPTSRAWKRALGRHKSYSVRRGPRVPRYFLDADAETRWDLVRDYIVREGPVAVEAAVPASFRAPRPPQGSAEHRPLGRRAFRFDEGGDDGGYRHALLCVGFDLEKRIGDEVGAYRFLNSYGREWRDEGYVWIPRSEVEARIETVVALEDHPSLLGPNDRIVIAAVPTPALIEARIDGERSERRSARGRDLAACKDEGSGADAWSACSLLRRLQGFPLRFGPSETRRVVWGPWYLEDARQGRRTRFEVRDQQNRVVPADRLPGLVHERPDLRRRSGPPGGRAWASDAFEVSRDALADEGKRDVLLDLIVVDQFGQQERRTVHRVIRSTHDRAARKPRRYPA